MTYGVGTHPVEGLFGSVDIDRTDPDGDLFIVLEGIVVVAGLIKHPTRASPVRSDILRKSR